MQRAALYQFWRRDAPARWALNRGGATADRTAYLARVKSHPRLFSMTVPIGKGEESRSSSDIPAEFPERSDGSPATLRRLAPDESTLHVLSVSFDCPLSTTV